MGTVMVELSQFAHASCSCVVSEGTVLLLAHQLAFRLAANLNLRNPAVALGILVQSTGLLLQLAVDLSDSAANGAEDVGCRLDRLYSANGITGGSFEADLGQLDVDDIAEGLRGVF